MKNVVFIVYEETLVNNREEMVPMSDAGVISFWKRADAAKSVASWMDVVAPVRKSDLPKIAGAYGLEVEEDEREPDGRSADPHRAGARRTVHREGDAGK